MKKRLIVIALISATVLIAGGAYLYVRHHAEEEQAAESTEVEVAEIVTRGGAYYGDDAPEADERVVGRWQSEENPHWYRVYTSDWETEDYFWGKEWNEDEDVLETDLRWHGNGWFLWKLEGNTVSELVVTDGCLAVIPHQYTITSITAEKMTYTEKRDKVVRSFRKVQ